MRAIVTTVIAVIEAIAGALTGALAVVIPAVLLWAVTFSLSADPGAVISGVSGTWLLAHFVPLHFELSAQAAAAFGLSSEALAFSISLAPLGITLITVLAGARSGWKFGERGGSGSAGLLGGFIGFAAVALVASAFAAPLLIWPMWASAVVPALVYAVPAVAAYMLRAARDDHPWWRELMRRTLRQLQRAGLRVAVLPSRSGEVLRLAAASLSALVGLSAVAFAVTLVLGYTDVISLTQALQPGAVGSILLFLMQLALLPLGIVWGIDWFSGAGFSLGVGTSVTPFETLVGPLPNLPVLGAIPDAWGPFGALAPALIVLLGIVLGMLFARRAPQRGATTLAAYSMPVLSAVLVGLSVVGLSALAAGSAGPDRLSDVGARPWIAGGLIAAEIGVGMLIGVAAGRFDLARVRSTFADGIDIPDSVRRLVSRPGDRDSTGRESTDRTSAPGAVSLLALPDLEDEARDAGTGEQITIDLAEVRAARGRRAEQDAQVASEDGLVDDAEFETQPYDASDFELGDGLDPDESDIDDSVDGATEKFEDGELPSAALRAARDGARGTDSDGADFDGADSDGAVADVEVAADPELYDQDVEPEPEEPSSEELEAEKLLRAYSWDAQEGEAEQAPKPRGWRWPGRKH